MSPEKTLLVLCMHGCKHAWSRLIWIHDIARLIACRGQLDWNASIDEAKRTGVWRPLALGVLLAHRVCGAPVPETFLRRFEKVSVAQRLARYFDRSLFSAPGSVPSGFVPYLFQLLSPRDQAWYFLSLEFLRPNERDRAMIDLPKPLHPLYLLLRPFRMLFDRSPRL